MENVLKIKEDVLNIAQEITDLKGLDTVVIDLNEKCSWTSYFIITTCSSNAHLKGIVNGIREKIHSLNYNIKQNRKNSGDQKWVLLDCADFVIHFMNSETREYYSLEDRWKDAETIYSSSMLS